MTDKLKCKRNLHRGRHIGLSILSFLMFINGSIVLAQNFNESVAPLIMPQCHFEQDRLFITGHPIALTSLNRGQYEPLLNTSVYDVITWSPDGTMFTGMPSKTDGMGNLTIYEENGSIIRELDLPWGILRWSEDSKYLSWSSLVSHSSYRHNVETGETISTPHSKNDYDYSSRKYHETSSPDDKYSVYAQYLSEVHWFVVNRNEPDREPLLMLTGDPMKTFLGGWSADSQSIYFVIDDMLTRYNMVSSELVNLIKLGVSPAGVTIKMLPNHEKILLDVDSNPIIVDLATLQFIMLGNIPPSEYTLWHPNNDDIIFVYGDNYTVNTYRDGDSAIIVYNVEANTIRHLDVIASNAVSLSSDGQYISYFDSLSPDHIYHRAYYLYDLENDTNTLVKEFEYKHKVQWFSHENKDYLLIQQGGLDTRKSFLTYIIDPSDMSTCAIGWTGEELSFQPHSN